MDKYSTFLVGGALAVTTALASGTVSAGTFRTTTGAAGSPIGTFTGYTESAAQFTSSATSSITLPAASFDIQTSIAYTTQATRAVILISNAEFDPTVSPTVTIFEIDGGSSLTNASAVSFSNVTVFSDRIVISPVGGTFSVIHVGSPTVKNMQALATSGSTVTLSGYIENPNVSATYENITSATYITSIGTSAVVSTFHQGSVASTLSSTLQSYFRFYNSSALSGTVDLTLYNAASGAQVGKWTSPSIGPGTAPQFPISLIEAQGLSTTKPSIYSVTIESKITGSFQHVMYAAGPPGLFTNVTTCENATGGTTNRLINVHSSRLGSLGFPSYISVYNTGGSAATATLNVYNATTGVLLGAYTTSAISTNSMQQYSVTQIENALAIQPGNLFYYVITMSGVTGYMRHLIYNPVFGTINDMSAVCPM